jgi:hypothetical protein
VTIKTQQSVLINLCKVHDDFHNDGSDENHDDDDNDHDDYDSSRSSTMIMVFYCRTISLTI